jgi:hypothetical protein
VGETAVFGGSVLKQPLSPNGKAIRMMPVSIPTMRIREFTIDPRTPPLQLSF